MDLTLGLNTLGIVFLALLVLIAAVTLLVLVFAVMVLNKAFSLAAGKEVTIAPVAAKAAVPAPGDTIGATVAQMAAATAPAAQTAPAPDPRPVASAPLAAPPVAAVGPTPAAAFGAGTYRMVVGENVHQVQIKDVTEKSATVVVDAVAFQVERMKGNSRVVAVNGKPYTVEVKDRTENGAGVILNGSPQLVRFEALLVSTQMKMLPRGVFFE